MDIPVEAERLMKIYNSMSKEQFEAFVGSSEQAQADMKVTAEWLEKELEPLVETVKGIAESLTEILQPIVNDLLANKEALKKIGVMQNTMSAGA